MAIKLRRRDCIELETKLSTLNCEIQNGKIWGTLTFCCWYDSQAKELEHDSHHRDAISDSFEIEIKFDKKDDFGFPSVYETGDKIPREAYLHINTPDGCCCLGIFPEYPWVSAYQYIIDKVVPFFYWQAHKEKYGEEPWKGYSHGLAGLKDAREAHKKTIQACKERIINDRYKAKIADNQKKICSLQKAIDTIEKVFLKKKADQLNSLRACQTEQQLAKDTALREKTGEPTGPNRNKLCDCGSKKKYKKCCFNSDKEINKKVTLIMNCLPRLSKKISDLEKTHIKNKQQIK